MKIKDIGEFGLIDRLCRRYAGRSTQDVVHGFMGIGDDCAVIDNGSKCFLWTTDILIEGVHFFSPYLPSTVDSGPSTAFMLGWKSMAVNLSDIASMGGIPKYAVVTLGLTGKEDIKFVDELYRGMDSVGQKCSGAIYRTVKIVGGDTSKSPVLMINISVIGEAEKKNLLLRKGACPGDIICVTGSCGDSAAGFEMIKKSVQCQVSSVKYKKNRRLSTVDCRRLILKHLMPRPRLKEGRIIAENKLATAMIDNSDGLLLSVKFICQPSGVGARIFEDKIPLSKELISAGQTFRFAAKHMALSGGEDYELIFTVPPHKVKEVINRVNRLTGQQVTAIGEITKDKEIYIIGPKGKKETIKNMGFSHFQKG